MLAIERRWLAGGGLLAIAALEDHLGRTLDEEHLFAFRGPVERRHKLVLGFERNGVDARIGGLLCPSIHAELRRKRIDPPLGRSAFSLPGAPILERFGMVEERGDAPKERP